MILVETRTIKMLKYLTVLSIIIFVAYKNLFNETPWELKLLRQITVHVKKIKRSNSPVLYYANCTATRNLILTEYKQTGFYSLSLSGDVELNPGPSKKTTKCLECSKTIWKNQKPIICDSCKSPTHLNCTQFKSITQHTWICHQCVLKEHPFATLRSLTEKHTTKL